MGAAFHDFQSVADHDPVQRGDRPARMEAAAAFGEAVMTPEIAQASAARAPFVEIAHHHRRRLSVAAGEMGEDGMGLSPPPQAGQIALHADDAKVDVAEPEVGVDGAARLPRGEGATAQDPLSPTGRQERRPAPPKCQESLVP